MIITIIPRNLLHTVRTWFKPVNGTDQAPLRAELFSADQMEQHGKALAKTHITRTFCKRDLLLKRLATNEQVLTATCRLLMTIIKDHQRIAPAGEWLLDNFYLIEEQIRTARHHLPKGYSRELPRLEQGVSQGLPRVYDIALNAISHGDGRVDAEILNRFVAAYQTVTPLTLGELWAIPIMLRLALIENLRRVSVHIADARLYLNQAQLWASQMMEVAERDPKSLILIIADMARSNPPMVSPFVAELARRLQGHGPALALPLSWIEQRLAESSLTIEQMVQSENQQQAADQVSISNSIASLRWLGAMDWREFVENSSCVEQLLQQDSSGVYGSMDFATRDRYRQVIDGLAKRTPFSEAEITHIVLTLAIEGARQYGREAPAAHVGFYLIDRGRSQLDDALTAPGPLASLRRTRGIRMPFIWYLSAITLLTAIFTALLWGLAYSAGIEGWRLSTLGILAALASSQLASMLVNWIATLVVEPKRLPRMDYARGLPREMCTLVVIPTLLRSIRDTECLLEALEVRFLGNRDAHIHFALLTDFRDAQEDHRNEDNALLQQARIGIEKLNAKYRSPPTATIREDRFFLLHRPRSWNRQERMWMGYERKRGKLADLNALLRGCGDKYFSLIVGQIGALSTVKYVITLDTDTQLPRDSARQFVATMAHPLNRPRFDGNKRRICSGYGILQPRMAASLAGTNRSRYARLCGEEPGIDPYTRSVSDVYQDLFGEGSFIGKGIYDVDAFDQVLKNQLPENRILSHDLLEGCYARSGLLSDVQLYEEYPVRYDTDMCRRERWIRGDWQIARWLLPWVPGPEGRTVRNPLSALSRWKIFDNLRRSVEPLVLLLLLLTGWWVMPDTGVWTLAAVAILLLPPVLAGLLAGGSKPKGMLWKHHLHAILDSTGHSLGQAVFRLACLPHEAVFNLAAILRSAGRMLFRHQGLLEWSTSTFAEQQNRYGTGIAGFVCILWAAPALAALNVVGLLLLRPEVLTPLPLLALWFVAPGLAWWLSLPQPDLEVTLNSEQTRFLQRIARKSWAYFDHFAGADDHWLVPDNVQEHPGPVVAHRTSPTNIGLSLLANVTACDFGFIPAGVLLQRTADCFNTLDQLKRHRGHFYNWYDTETLLPLHPHYISSVDSGNLAGHLLTLRVALQDLPEQKVLHPRFLTGLATTLDIVEQGIVADIDREMALGSDAEMVLEPVRNILDAACAHPPANLSAASQQLTSLIRCIDELAASLAPETEARTWADDLQKQCHCALQDLNLLAPWLTMSEAPGSLSMFVEDADIPTLGELTKRSTAQLIAIDTRLQDPMTPDESAWLTLLRRLTHTGNEYLTRRISQAAQLAQQANGFAAMEYDFLYDNTRHLLAVGYNVDELRRDAGFYDLLASEARLCSFVAIAQGQVPQESWFALGRLLTTAGGDPVLVSWSGSMFEYLMPMLVMPSYAGTLLDQTCRAAVARQIAYGQQCSVPWGVSESGYNSIDAGLNYQYHAFGVPGLGLKRGMAEDLVIAPYASALALMVAPEAACANLQRLAANGLEGRYGMYEAVDYTPARLTRNQTSVVVRSFMAHHQGMSLLALAFRLLDRPMQRRFESDPLCQSALLLLQEKIPKATIFQPLIDENAEAGALFEAAENSVFAAVGPDTQTPEVQLLSNGQYHVMLTNAGGGYSRCKDLAVTRWREDTTCDNWGSFIYLRDTGSGEFWSATHQPTLKNAQSYSALFSEGRAEYRRRDQDIETHSEIVVSPEDDIELRRVRITNRSSERRSLEVTSYAEVVLAPVAADMMQPSFSNLFVQTEILPGANAIICTRRPRSIDDKAPYMFQLLAVHGNDEDFDIGKMSAETDRMCFIGRGRTLVAPQALRKTGELSGNQGSVLDPIVAIRCPFSLTTEKTITLDLVTGVAHSRDACLALIGKYQDRHLTNRVLDLAWTHSGVILRQINASEGDASLYRRLASSILYANAVLRSDSSVLMQNRRSQSGLWGYAISGDLPIVLLKIASSDHIELARQLIQCHAYWRLKGLMVDLVIWNEDHIGYRQRLQDQIMGLIATGIEAHAIDRPGGIFVRSAEQISSEDRILLQAVARAILSDNRGTLEEQVNRRQLAERRVPALATTRTLRYKSADPSGRPRKDLLLGNGVGGFSADGREYIITTSQDHQTPAPWVNVLANPHFGSVVAESGLAYTWSENAHEYRLTPWSEDAVGASGGEALYLRDEDTGYYWSPSPQPSRGATPYVSRHGFGYSIFEHTENGIQTELCVYVDLHDSVKYSVLKVRNLSGRPRRLSATGYVEWVLGDLRSKSALHVVTEIDADSGALFARNAYSTEFGTRVAFFDVDDLSRTLTGDRTEFLGRNGTLRRPEALKRAHLSGRLGAALDPCGAIQVPFELLDGQVRDIIFRLGAGQDLPQTRALAQRLRRSGTARAALKQVQQYWQRTLGAVQVDTPDVALNLLANGWLVYQTMACRFWARSGFYQSGGAFGFRDQLQDAMALMHAQPELLRQHLLQCASRQYSQGDVQHWWHPPLGRGVRTRCSDDYLWLPLAVCRYVVGTGDTGILDEMVGFIDGRPLNDDEESYYDLPVAGNETASLYQHCVRAIQHGLNFGEKGLPLMGSGDWNDGMNLVGIHGQGESVWLGFLLYQVLQGFAELAEGHDDPGFAGRCRSEAKKLRANLAQHAWDGGWYRRAWFDDGTPLGSAVNPECSIDSIAQSWSVLSGAGDDERCRIAMDALDQHLVRRDHKLIQLLDPPFDRSDMNPGYIKGYVPGVRENGGQYTHAAIWAAMAFAALDDSRAWELLNLINPINHGQTPQDVAIYKVEPYVVAADVYGVSPHNGRGGWTWYTGSSGWLYRLILESLLGLTREADNLRIRPCLPEHWTTYSIHYRFGNTVYEIVVTQTVADSNGMSITLDGVTLVQPCIPLTDDQQPHQVEVFLQHVVSAGDQTHSELTKTTRKTL
ncbi:GH36-type glycosyl hydrolase domain-containing protein [Gynuella sp.]|uniref:GH36-type glycosyl hydrolase domain-containing protein n=1 Tax=Gynuella sp. TaxID=2969146 RepID=UPI003D1455E2